MITLLLKVLEGADEFRLLRAPQQLPVLDAADIIRTFVQIGGDMGGIKDAPCPILNQGTKKREQVISGDGIQTAGGLIEDEQLRPVG